MLCHFERLDSTKQWSFFFCLLKGRKESPQNKRPLSQTFFSKGVDKLNTLWKSCNWGKNSPLLTKRSHFLSFQVSLKSLSQYPGFQKRNFPWNGKSHWHNAIVRLLLHSVIPTKDFMFPKITPQKKAKTCLFWLYRVTTACIWDVISTWKLHSPFTLAFPKGPMSHSLFQGNSTFDGSQMIGKGNVTCWSHVCVLYIPLWLLRAKLSLISKAPHTKLLPLRKFIEATFCVASDQRKSWKKERQKRINAPNLQLCFQNQNSRRKGKKFYLSQNNCSRRKSFWLD